MASGLPCNLLDHVSKGKSHYHLCKLTLKPLITVLHLLHHHPQCYQHPEAASQLLACTQGCKSIPKESKTPPKYFHYANAAPAPSLFNKSCSGSMQKLFQGKEKRKQSHKSSSALLNLNMSISLCFNATFLKIFFLCL